MSLTACKTPDIHNVHTVSEIYIPDTTFECIPRPEKPKKYLNSVTMRYDYRDSDVARFINSMSLSRDDCAAKLQEAKQIYNEQKSSQTDKKAVDTPKGQN